MALKRGVKGELDHKKLLNDLHYDPTTGIFVWRVKRGNQFAIAGRRAGSDHINGHRTLFYAGNAYMEHRLAWFYVHGQWPVGQIDHINGNERDNRLINLRDVSGSVNCQNKRRAPSTSRHGYLGASPIHGRWRAQITIDRKKTYLGMFDTPQEAHAAYVEAKRKYHQGCTI